VNTFKLNNILVLWLMYAFVRWKWVTPIPIGRFFKKMLYCYKIHSYSLHSQFLLFSASCWM